MAATGVSFWMGAEAVRFIEPLKRFICERRYFDSCIIRDELSVTVGDTVVLETGRTERLVGKVLSLYKDEGISILNMAGSTLSPCKGEFLLYFVFDELPSNTKETLKYLPNKHLYYFVPVNGKSGVVPLSMETRELKIITNSIEEIVPTPGQSLDNEEVCYLKAGFDAQGNVMEARVALESAYHQATQFLEDINGYLDEVIRTKKRGPGLKSNFKVNDWLTGDMLHLIYPQSSAQSVVKPTRSVTGSTSSSVLKASKRLTSATPSRSAKKQRKTVSELPQDIELHSDLSHLFEKSFSRSLKESSVMEKCATPPSKVVPVVPDLPPSMQEGAPTTLPPQEKPLDASFSHHHIQPHAQKPQRRPSSSKVQSPAPNTDLSFTKTSKPLKHRGFEFEFIKKFLKGKISKGQSGCLYISGLPGSGKTETIMRVCSEYNDRPHIKLLYINGANYTSARGLLVEMCRKFFDVDVSEKKALFVLDQHFCSPHTIQTILIVDEFDHLCSTDQYVWYNLCEWTTNANARLVFLAVANTYDLPERVLSKQVASRFGSERLSFNPYTFSQLVSILNSHMKNCFDADALVLITRRVAAVCGDFRRCLTICQKAHLLARKENSSLVQIKHVEEAFKLLATNNQRVIQSLPEMCKRFLISLDNLASKNSESDCSLDEILNEITRVYATDANHDPPPDTDCLIKMANYLSTLGLIQQNINLKLRFKPNFQPSDVKLLSNTQ